MKATKIKKTFTPSNVFLAIKSCKVLKDKDFTQSIKERDGDKTRKLHKKPPETSHK